MANPQAVEMVVTQGLNVLKSMNGLWNFSNRKMDKASDDYTRFFANFHSFDVYTHMDPEVDENEHVQAFQQHILTFDAPYAPLRVKQPAEVDVKESKELYEAAVDAYNKMVTDLGKADKVVNAKYL